MRARITDHQLLAARLTVGTGYSSLLVLIGPYSGHGRSIDRARSEFPNSLSSRFAFFYTFSGSPCYKSRRIFFFVYPSRSTSVVYELHWVHSLRQCSPPNSLFYRRALSALGRGVRPGAFGLLSKWHRSIERHLCIYLFA